MRASLKALFGEGLAAASVAPAIEQARDTGLGRLRVAASPAAAGTLCLAVGAAKMEATELFPSPQPPIALHSLPLHGGLGAHKWTDRRLLAGAEAEGPAGSLPLLIDGDGAVLEASRANIFAVRKGALLTPPADGRLLAGITRRRALEVAAEAGIEVREQSLGIAELVGAEEVFLTGTLRGVEPVCSLDGAILAPAGELSERIAAGLRRRWLGEKASAAAPALAASRRRDRPVR